LRFRFKRTSVALAGAALVAVAGLSVAAPAMAASCTTSDVSGNCGPYSDPAVFRTANAADLVTQNDFSAIPQTLTATDSTTWTVAASTVGQGDQTSVKSYPATQVTYTTTADKPEPSATFGATLTSAWTDANPSGAGQDYEYAFDDWLANPANNSWNNDLEVMIWTDNHGQRPAGSDTGTVYTDAAGTAWEVWTAGGASSVSPVSTVSFVRASNAASGSIDRIGFYAYLQAHSLLASTYGVDQLNYGLEVCSTGGATQTYGVTGYTIVPNGTQQGGAPTAAPVTHTTVTGSKVVISWGSVATATKYEVQVALPNGTLWHDSTVTATSATYSPVPTTGTYHYKVRAQNASGSGPWSPVGTFTVSH
jgi:hypothetical protein